MLDFFASHRVLARQVCKVVYRDEAPFELIIASGLQVEVPYLPCLSLSVLSESLGERSSQMLSWG